MRIAICDDENIFTEQLYNLIIGYLKNKGITNSEINIYHSGDELLNDTAKIDLVFLDIEMPGVDGIYTGRELYKKNKNVIVIIITSFSEYLDDAMRFNVFRYLNKPVDKARLFRNLDDAIHVYNHRSKELIFEINNTNYLLTTNEIIMVETCDRRTKIITTLGELISTDSIQIWSEKLNYPCFYQPHRSCIINFDYVCSCNHDTIVLDGGKYTAYLAKRKYHMFKEKWLTYIEKNE